MNLIKRTDMEDLKIRVDRLLVFCCVPDKQRFVGEAEHNRLAKLYVVRELKAMQVAINRSLGVENPFFGTSAHQICDAGGK